MVAFGDASNVPECGACVVQGMTRMGVMIWFQVYYVGEGQRVSEDNIRLFLGEGGGLIGFNADDEVVQFTYTVVREQITEHIQYSYELVQTRMKYYYIVEKLEFEHLGGKYNPVQDQEGGRYCTNLGMSKQVSVCTDLRC